MAFANPIIKEWLLISDWNELASGDQLFGDIRY
jgi:hypothetical protein